MINDRKIKTLIMSYNQNSSVVLLDVIKKKLSLFIYYYPIKSYSQTEDVGSEFLTKILNELPHILSKYKPSSATFLTWFLIVLRNKYYTFIKKKNEIELKTLPIIKQFADRIYDLSDITQFKDWNESRQNSHSKEEKTLKNYLNHNLTYMQKKILTVLFSDLTLDYFQNDSMFRKQLYEEYKKSKIKIIEKRNKLLFKMQLLHFKILKLEQENFNHTKIIHAKKQLENFQDNLRKMKLNIPYSLAGKILNLDIQTIKNYMFRIKNKIYKFYNQEIDK